LEKANAAVREAKQEVVKAKSAAAVVGAWFFVMREQPLMMEDHWDT
jgi:hypothetical protein